MSKAAGLFLSLAASVCLQAQVIYVDADALGNETGQNWVNAFADLQDALAIATGGNEIWIAEGLYTPTNGNDRTISFLIPDGIGVYGGFDGSEETRDQRDWTVFESVLSGDVGMQSDSTDNSYNVVTAIGTSSSTILDGVTVQHGKASVVTPPFDRGAGLYAPDSDIIVRNSTFRWNVASVGGGSQRGGGIYFEQGAPLVEDCDFVDNVGLGAVSDIGGSPTIRDSDIVGTFGGGLFLDSGSSALVEDVVIENGELGGVYIIGSSPHFIRTTIRNNSIQNSDGGGIRMSDGSAPIFEDCLIEGNSADAGGGANISSISTPLFLRTTFRENIGGAAKLGNSSGTFIGCTFDRNVLAGPGAIIALNSGMTVVNSIFTGNRSEPASSGGAINYRGPSFLGDPVLIANSLFVGNETERGGAVSVFFVDAGGAELVNVVFAGNEATSVGGAIYSHDAPGLEIHNAILWGNIAPLDPEIHIAEGGPPIVEHAIVAGGYPSGTDIQDQDPLFVRNPDPGPDGNWGTDDDDYGDLRLREDSPGVDYGLQAFLPADIWDLDNDGNTTERLPIDLNGEARVQGAEVDLGPYEGAVIVANEPEAPEETAELRVYPNPASDFLFVYTDAGEVEIVDVLGRVVLRSTVGERIDVSNLSNGVYVVRAAGESRVVSVRR